MKKVFAVVIALCMLFSVALAEEGTSITWEEVLPVIEASGVNGDFHTFDEIAVKIWLPEGLNAIELTDEDKEQGYIGYFMPDDQSGAVAVMYVDLGGMSLEDYAAQLGEYGATEIEMATINGLPAVTYKMPENDSMNVAFTTQAGYGLEIICTPASIENADMLWGAVCSSIQPE